MFSPHPVPDDFHAAMPLAFRMRPGQLRASAQDAGRMMSSADHLYSRYREIRVPAAVIAGADDGVVNPEDQSQRLVVELQRGELDLITGAGHMVHYSHPDRLVSAAGRILSYAGVGEPTGATS